MNDTQEIYLEIGQKKIFAVFAHWPGWACSGRDESAAIQSLWNSTSRYKKMLSSSRLVFQAPASISEYVVLGKLKGNATTDFGAPDALFPDDWADFSEEELEIYKVILNSCWKALDQAILSAQGKELRKGPRGGGRDLDTIIKHVLESEEGYLRVLGLKPERMDYETIMEKMNHLRHGAFKGLELAINGQIPREGPKGGKRWPPRFYIRRLAWHTLDHAWEIEDRIIS